MLSPAIFTITLHDAVIPTQDKKTEVQNFCISDQFKELVYAIFVFILFPENANP